MKIYISVDMEGITGVCHWDQVCSTHRDYPRHRAQMAREVVAACKGALAAGATEIVVKDAHATGRNLDGSELPAHVELISGWSGHPLNMVQELDGQFDAALFVGYHAPAGSLGNPLAHTFSSRKVAAMRLNDQLASEYLVCAYAAEMFSVPVVFVSGDEHLCAHVAEHSPACRTVSTMRGIGTSVIAAHPHEVVERIHATTKEVLQGELDPCRLKQPEDYRLEIDFRQPTDAYAYGFYPGAEQINETTVRYHTREYFDILRAIKFLG